MRSDTMVSGHLPVSPNSAELMGTKSPLNACAVTLFGRTVGFKFRPDFFDKRELI
jgi:hypothetical protein